MKNFTQLLPGRDGSNAKTNNTSGHAHAFTLILTLLLTLGAGQMWGDYTWNSGDLLYYDFTAVTSGGVNWHNGSSLLYDASGYGKVKKVEFSSSVTMNTSWVIAKTENGSWNNITFTNPPSVNQRRFIISSNGKSGSWGYLDKYIAGDSWGGIGSWSTTTKKMTNNGDGTYTVSFTSIAASAHKFKITNYDTWTGAVGYSSNVSCVNGTVADDGTNDHNSSFTPSHAGNVIIMYNCSTGKIVIQCPYQVSYAAGTGASGSVSASAITTYGSTCTLSSSTFSKTGYTQDGWATSDGGDKAYNLGGTNNGGYTDVTLYPHWKANTTTVTLDLNGGTAGATSVTATYDSELPSFTLATKTGSYNLTGYWTESSGGTKVINADGTFAANSGIWNRTDGSTLTLYAQWSSFLTVTYDGNGNTGGTAPTDANEYSSGATVTVKAKPDGLVKTGYSFTGWKAGGVTYTAGQTFTITANTTLVAQWSENTYTVTISGGTASTTTAGISTTGTATVSLPAGKKFTGWTLGSGVTLVTGTTSSETITFHASQASSVTAGFADRAGVKVYFAKPTTLSWGTLYAYAWQNGGSATNGSYPGVELSTTETINCVTYYVYQYYTEADGIGGAATGNSAWNRIIFGCNDDAKKTGDLTISDGHYYYVNSTTTGKDAAIASAWYIKGTMNSWGETDVMTHACATNTATKDIELSGGTNYSFKVYDEVNNNWWTTGNTDINSSFTATTLSSSGYDMVIKPAVTGDYTFTVSSTDGTPKLAISFPEFYSIVGSFNEWNTEADELGFSGDVGTAVINLSGNTTAYEFKVIDKGAWSGTASTLNITGTVSNQAISVGSGNNINLTADIYPDGDYTFTYNKSTNKLGVTYPASYVVTFGKRTGGSTVTAKINNTTSFDSGTKIKPSTSVTFAQTAASGYTFEGWYNAESGGTKLSSSSSYTTTISAATAVYANYTPNDYEITLDKNTGTADGTVTVTYNSTATKLFTEVTKTGYNCTGYWTAESGGYKVVNNDGSLASYSSNISTYLNTNGTWKKTTATTLYAQWTPETYTITLDKNGGTSNGTATATYDSNKLTSITAPTKTGYHTVDGYYKEGGTTNKISDLSGNLQASTTYTNASSQWSSTSNQTLYAKWAANTYTIAFNANDANYVGEATGTTASIAATYGVSYTLTANGFSRAGYTFNGWNTNADGTSGTNYSNSQTGVSNLTATNGATVTLYAKWTGNTYTVSFNKGAGTCAVSSSTVTFGSPYSDGTGLSGSLPEVTPPSGSVFNGWYDAPVGGNKIDDETLVTTASDHTLYARYTQRDRVYFYNNLGWSDVYVTYDPRDWNDTYGTGNDDKIYHHMTQIEGTNIWYDDIPEVILSNWKWFIAFNDKLLGTTGTDGGWEWFNSGNAVYRHDFDSYATMFVPGSGDSWKKNNNTCTYYSSSWTYDAAGGGHGENYRQSVGYWMRYNDVKSGYSITGTWDSWANSTSLKAATPGATSFAVTKVLEANTTYDFLLYKEYTHNTYNHVFTNTGTMTSANCTDWTFTTANAQYSSLASNHAHITTTVAGEYVFILTPGTDGTLKISVEYPTSTNDYRVLYSWNDGSAHEHASEIIKGAASTEKTISVFVHKASDVTSRSLKIQQCTDISGAGVPTWTDRNTIDLSKIDESGVYNFVITQPAEGYATGEYYNKYSGNYYIRTESSDGGWDYYKTQADNIMTRSDYSLTQTLSAPFSHYYCRYIENTGMDITYQIATDYSPCVSEVMVGDATIGGDEETTLPAPANVRFSWNEKTNALRRAYLKSAQGATNTRYLVLHGESDGMIYNTDGTDIAANGAKSLAKNELLFTDIGNWIYQVELKAEPGSAIKLIAQYNSSDRYLIGDAENSATLIGGEGSTKYGITAVYDFKTNRLMTAWTPSSDISEQIEDVDIMLIRYKQNAATSIRFTGEGSLNANKVIGALEFRYDDMVGHVAAWTSSSRPLLMYFISFPFDVNVSDVFGLNSAYGDAYVIRKYDGAERAKKGFFKGDGTTTFWTDLPLDSVMHANQGYYVVLDNDYFNGDVGSVWENKTAGSKVYLYFPSAKEVGDIESDEQTINVPSHECKIDRTFDGGTKNHMITDSHWNMMGVPIFDNHTGVNTTGTPGAVFLAEEDEEQPFKYFYSWSPSTNAFSITNAIGFEFLSMHSYMVQYYGPVTFTGSAPVASVSARRTPAEKYNLELQVLNSNKEMLNHTYVELREEACDTFALNEDVYMSSNTLAVNIYTFAGQYDVAANVLSIGNHTIPVGVEVRTAGTYTISMPSSFSGTATLLDKETGIRTNLAISDYEVALPKGVINERFAIEISDISNVITDIEYTNGEGSLKDGKAHKFIRNGLLYIVRDGEVYDARGAKVE